MSDWRTDIEDAVSDFLGVAVVAHDPISRGAIDLEFLPAPHTIPRGLPAHRMAIYGFWYEGTWLKIGKAGPKSHARFGYQHYMVNGARSTLARSLVSDPRMAEMFETDPAQVATWIRTSTCRVNILIPSTRKPDLLSLLEAFLHLRLSPRYEG